MINKIKNYYLRHRKPVKYLKKNGANLGVNIIIEAPFNCGEPELVSIGNNCNFSFDVTFICHDGSNVVPEHLGMSEKGARKYGKIIVGNNVFIGAKTIVLPNVKIGDNVIIGAGSLVTHSIPSNTVAGGVPARPIKSLKDYCEKNIPLFISKNDFDNKKYIIKNPEI